MSQLLQGKYCSISIVCPGLANSLGMGQSLALLVMLVINNCSKETGGTVARGAETHSCLGGRCTGASPPLRDAGSDQCQHPCTHHKVDQGNQVTAEMGCSFTICRRRVWESLTWQVPKALPWSVGDLSLLGCEGQGGLCWQMMSPAQSAGHPPYSCKTELVLCSPEIVLLEYLYL